MKALIVFLLLCFILISCGSNNEFTINGTIDIEHNGELIYLSKVFSEDLQLDSAIIIDGKFSFSGSIQIPEIYGFTIPSVTREGCTFILEPSNLLITLDKDAMYNDGFKVSGGPINEEFNRVHNYQNQTYYKLIKSLRSAEEPVDDKIKELERANSAYVSDYIKENPDSPVSLYLLMWSYFRFPLDELNDLLTAFSPDMRSTSVYKRIESDYNTQLAIKNEKQAFELKGDPKYLDVEFTDNSILEPIVELNPNKILYVDLWSTTCGPCFKEFPYSRELYSKINHQKCEFIYLCVKARNEQEWKEKIIEYKLSGQHYLLDWGQAQVLYKELGGIKGQPYYLIIGQDGTVVHDNAPRPSYDGIEEVIGELI